MERIYPITRRSPTFMRLKHRLLNRVHFCTSATSMEKQRSKPNQLSHHLTWSKHSSPVMWPRASVTIVGREQSCQQRFLIFCRTLKWIQNTMMLGSWSTILNTGTISEQLVFWRNRPNRVRTQSCAWTQPYTNKLRSRGTIKTSLIHSTKSWSNKTNG